MRTRLALLVVAVLLLVAAAASCEDQRSYVYSAQKFEADKGCLDTYTTVEVVQGAGANATCAPTCMSVGDSVFVSTMCPPLPAVATALPTDASPCLEALDAEVQEASCANAGSGDDGGGEAGDDGGDDGGGDDGGGDASEDAPADAPADG
jgi:hypothetical protein